MWWGLSGKRWTAQDRLLTLALAAYEESLCGDCGQDKSVTYNPDAEGWFESREVICAGCAAQQQHNGQNQKRPPGQKVYVVDARPADLDLKPWSLSSPDGGQGE